MNKYSDYAEDHAEDRKYVKKSNSRLVNLVDCLYNWVSRNLTLSSLQFELEMTMGIESQISTNGFILNKMFK